MDEFHPSESTIIQIAGGTFKGTEASRIRNLEHILACTDKDGCKPKYDAALLTKPASKSEAGIGGWFRRKFGGG